MLAKFGTNSGGITWWSKFELIQVLKRIQIQYSWKDNSSCKLYTLGPLCLWQCLYYIALHFSLQKWWRVGVQQLRRAKDQFSQARISLVESELSRKWIPATPPAYLIFVILKCKNYTLLKHRIVKTLFKHRIVNHTCCTDYTQWIWLFTVYKLTHIDRSCKITHRV